MHAKGEPRGGRNLTGETDRVAAAQEPLILEEWRENKGRALMQLLAGSPEHNDTLVYLTKS